MKRRAAFKSLLPIALLSVIGNAIWLYEIAGVIGWHSLSWLYSLLYSPYVVALLPALAYVTAYWFCVNTIKSKWQWAAIVLLLYFIDLGFYFVGKWYCYTAFGRFGLMWVSVPFAIAIAGFIFLLLGICYWVVTDRLIVPVKKKLILVITGICLMAVPLSLGTFFLMPGFGGPGDFIDGVKMGYPVFWITLLLGVSGMVGARIKTK